MVKIKPHHVHLICNAKYHDTDFARSELVNLFSEHDDLGVSISQDYSDFYKFKDSDLLITYTCDLSPAQEEVDTLREFLNNGGKWFGLHGTNALIEFVGEMQIVDGLEIPGKTDTPNKNPELMKLLGSRFIAHPPNMTIKVKVNDKSHPITKDLEDFEIFDEPYYCEFSDGIKILLESRYTDDADAYVSSSWKEDIPRPQMYLHKVGKGSVLYLMLGHCRGKYDMRPFMDECPVDRGGWESEVFYELLRRGIRWGINKL